jgi:hypothetical protein
MRWKFDKDSMSKKLDEAKFELKYHLHVMRHLTRYEMILYIVQVIFGRDCMRGRHCLGQASLKKLDTRHRDEMSNYVFYCDKCHREAEKILERFWVEFTPLEESSIDITDEEVASTEDAFIVSRRRERRQLQTPKSTDQ